MRLQILFKAMNVSDLGCASLVKSILCSVRDSLLVYFLLLATVFSDMELLALVHVYLNTTCFAEM